MPDGGAGVAVTISQAARVAIDAAADGVHALLEVSTLPSAATPPPPALSIRVTLTLGHRVRFLRQLHPRAQDLTAGGRQRQAADTGRLLVEFATAGWQVNETRQYHLCVDADPQGQPPREDLQLGWVEVAPPRVPARVAAAATPAAWAASGPVPLVVHWLPVERPPSTVAPSVAPSQGGQQRLHQLGEDLGCALGDGYGAFLTGDHDVAEARLAHAVRLADELNDHQRSQVLREFLHVENAATGAASLRPTVDPRRLDRLVGLGDAASQADAAELDAPSATTRRPRRPRVCRAPGCGAASPPHARFCMSCGRALGDDGREAGA